jgi:hypothetical protein
MKANIAALIILAAIAAALNACATPKNDYWADLAQGVRQKQR